MLHLQTKGIKRKVVTESDTAKTYRSGSLDVLATPALGALMEETALYSINGQIEPGQTTVGTELDIKHLAPSPIGANIICQSTLVDIDRKALTFKLEAFDESGKIAEATHKRFIVNAADFQAKAKTRHY